MQAYFMTGPKTLALKEVALPPSELGGLLLKTLSVSICSTDVGYYRGYLEPPCWPIIPGHEYLGEVVESSHAGDVSLRSGDKIVYWGQTDFGGLAEYRSIRPIFPGTHKEMQWLTDRHFMDDHQAAAILIEDDFPLEHATLLEPITSVLRAILGHPPRPGDDAIILGAGPCGVLGAQILRRMFGVRHITMLDCNPLRLAVAALSGVDLALDVVNDAEPLARLLHDSRGAHAQYLLDALPDITGSTMIPNTRSLGMQLLAPNGYYLVYGATEKAQSIDTWLILSKGLRIGSTPFDVREFSMSRSASVLAIAKNLVARRFLDLNHLITRVVSFREETLIRSVFDDYGQNSHMKTLISVAPPAVARLPFPNQSAA
ncbi:L-iditol 2-dehydrogenase/threonine 3-dehydrogenase [Stigmatella aurantiaca]|uniref:L-iditol 2-dehydrogenase/threonine 3-dehydrogenase n=1 Tax=Stigmatella aurantiaca TaxID=41 RepID=A0A1H7QDC0_STIAU|nr:alcohol dehydrogenase catalytic domain-containing protein [Stigmatella aurantiaca]SEL46100.1 L-iditol 2-dehydrogenase/threonine 3-dehydrogenase [Stigmatella aurantiaca]